MPRNTAMRARISTRKAAPGSSEGEYTEYWQATNLCLLPVLAALARSSRCCAFFCEGGQFCSRLLKLGWEGFNPSSGLTEIDA
jgi:hypothetical protein